MKKKERRKEDGLEKRRPTVRKKEAASQPDPRR
jgi:hypothetical protein